MCVYIPNTLECPIVHSKATSDGRKILLKGSRMGHSVKVSLWCVSLLLNTRFHFFLKISE